MTCTPLKKPTKTKDIKYIARFAIHLPTVRVSDYGPAGLYRTVSTPFFTSINGQLHGYSGRLGWPLCLLIPTVLPFNPEN